MRVAKEIICVCQQEHMLSKCYHTKHKRYYGVCIPAGHVYKQYDIDLAWRLTPVPFVSFVYPACPQGCQGSSRHGNRSTDTPRRSSELVYSGD